VFKYEAFETEVWPFLRRAGVVRASDGAEKINSAGSVSEIAAKCWAFVSKETLEDFVRLYAVDFKNLGYDPTDFGKDAAAAAAALGAARGGRLTVDVRAMIDRAASATLGLTERDKAAARQTVVSVRVSADELAAMTHAAGRAGGDGGIVGRRRRRRRRDADVRLRRPGHRARKQRRRVGGIARVHRVGPRGVGGGGGDAPARDVRRAEGGGGTRVGRVV
jgi:hypothetical protein